MDTLADGLASNNAETRMLAMKILNLLMTHGDDPHQLRKGAYNLMESLLPPVATK